MHRSRQLDAEARHYWRAAVVSLIQADLLAFPSAVNEADNEKK